MLVRGRLEDLRDWRVGLGTGGAGGDGSWTVPGRCSAERGLRLVRVTGVSRQSETLLDLSLSRGALDRTGHWRRDPALLPALLDDPGTRVIEVHRQRTRTYLADGRLHLVFRPPAGADVARLALFLGRDGAGTAYVAVVLDDAEGHEELAPDEPGGQGWSTLREAGAALDDTESGIFTAAGALANWHARHPFCPRCGGPTTPEQGGWVRRCGHDGSEHYPRTDVAVIMAIIDAQDRILLARGPHWATSRRSVLAGFVEPGEPLEAAVSREVGEEVGIEITDIDYRGNQPWPFPAQLMVGFTARAVDTELTLDPDEIAEARWFTRDELGGLVAGGALGVPSRVSIARRLIEDWFGGPLPTP